MTNREKFNKVFGYPPKTHLKLFEHDVCLIPFDICSIFDVCTECPFQDWWNQEYKEHFKLEKGDNNGNMAD